MTTCEHVNGGWLVRHGHVEGEGEMKLAVTSIVASRSLSVLDIS